MTKSQGYSLKTWTTWIALYSLVLSMLGLTWTIQLIFTLTSVPQELVLYKWLELRKLKDSSVIMKLTETYCVFLMMWFISALLLLYGNMREKNLAVYPWILVTAVVTLHSVGVSGYLIVKTILLLKTQAHDPYLNLLTLFSGAVVPWILNAYCLTFVMRRSKEIMKSEKKNTPFSVRYTRMKDRKKSLRLPVHQNSAFPLTDLNLQIDYDSDLSPNEVLYSAADMKNRKVNHSEEK